MQPLIASARRYLNNAFYPEALITKNLTTDWRGIVQRLRRLPISQDLPTNSLGGRFSALSSTEWSRLVQYNIENIETIVRQSQAR